MRQSRIVMDTDWNAMIADRRLMPLVQRRRWPSNKAMNPSGNGGWDSGLMVAFPAPFPLGYRSRYRA
jgi:hypothetical protein